VKVIGALVSPLFLVGNGEVANLAGYIGNLRVVKISATIGENDVIPGPVS